MTPFRESREQKDQTYHHSQVCKPFRVLLWSPRLSTEHPRKSLQQTRNGQIISWAANPKGVGAGRESVCVHTSLALGTQRVDGRAWTVDGQSTDAIDHS